VDHPLLAPEVGAALDLSQDRLAHARRHGIAMVGQLTDERARPKTSWWAA
jgi:hypothetical protein